MGSRRSGAALSCAALLLSVAMLGSLARGQSQPDGNAIDDIVVTVNKREEKLNTAD